MSEAADPELLYRLGVALAIGFLLGIERGWRDREAGEGHRAAGVRTFSLLGLLGGVAGALSAATGPLVLAITLLVSGVGLALFMYREALHEGDFSATSLVAALLTMSLGAFAALGDVRVAGAAGVAATVLLAVKEPLHSWVARLTWRELKSGLLLAAMTVILLPLLPDRTIDPWGVFNPYQIWLLTVLIAAVSFAGYCLVRMAGPRRGALLSALAGGLVSSTAVTLSFSRLVKTNGGHEPMLAACVVASGTAMIFRVAVLLALIAPALLRPVAPAVVAAATCSGLFIWWAFSQRERTGPPVVLAVENPFELAEVIKFSLLLTVILFGAQIARDTFGESGLLILAAISGIADVDAITLTAARLSVSPPSREIAAAAILVAVFVNNLAKVALSAWAGNPRLGAWVLAGTLPGAVAAGAVFLMVSH
jgi:uncharacterized membrane protein (DUF4010 family)